MKTPTLRRLAGAVFVGLMLAAGCTTDTRKSLDELRAMEQNIAQESVARETPVVTANLELSEIQPYRVGPGDTLALNITNFQESDYKQTIVRVRVHDDGCILLPLIGWVKVSGKTMEERRTLAEIEQIIYDAHVPKFVKELSVFAELVGPETTTVLVSGAAGQRGLVNLKSNQRNVLYALAASGGFAPGTSGRIHVRPVRVGQDERVYDLTKMEDIRLALVSPPLESGDTVYVEAFPASLVYLLGLVNRPGPIPVDPASKLSVVRAVAAAGGLIDFLDPKEATLWRRLPNGEQVRVKLELADMLAGLTEDFELQPGDVLDVPHTADTRVRMWAVQNLRLGPFGMQAVYDPWQYYQWRQTLGQNNINRNVDFSGSVLNTLLNNLPNVIVPPVPTPTP